MGRKIVAAKRFDAAPAGAAVCFGAPRPENVPKIPAPGSHLRTLYIPINLQLAVVS